MIADVKIKKPFVSSLSTAAICFGGIGVLAPNLAEQFESHLSEIIAASREMLGIVLQNKIAVIKPAYQRDRKWVLKTINRLLKIESEHIELSGAELLAICKFLKEEMAFEISAKGTYLVPLAEAERILLILNDTKRYC